MPLKADFALIAARRADYHGNLEYSLTARNFNPLMAMAATLTIAEAEQSCRSACIPPDAVVTPGVLVETCWSCKGGTQGAKNDSSPAASRRS